jgi:hypothetical protein
MGSLFASSLSRHEMKDRFTGLHRALRCQNLDDQQDLRVQQMLKIPHPGTSAGRYYFMKAGGCPEAHRAFASTCYASMPALF